MQDFISQNIDELKKDEPNPEKVEEMTMHIGILTN